MERIKEKLHSQSGASFLLALLAFLVAAVVSVVIVTAAVTNVKRIYSDREAQQDHLTLLSAAQLVRDEMNKTLYIYETTVTTTVTKDAEGKETEDTHTSEKEYAVGTFETQIEAAFQHFKNNGSTYDSDSISNFTISVDELKTVNVSFTMQPKQEQYKIVFTLSIDNSGEPLSVKNSDKTLFLVMLGSGPSPYGEAKYSDNSVTTSKAIQWKTGIISAVGDTAGGTNEQEAQK